jgi:hypothetical protein
MELLFLIACLSQEIVFLFGYIRLVLPILKSKLRR